MNSKLRISDITLSISSFNFWMGTGRIQCFAPQHLLTDLSFLGHQVWPSLPEYRPEDLSYTSWCSPSPSFHLLWNLRKLQGKNNNNNNIRLQPLSVMFCWKTFLLISNLRFLTTVEKEVTLGNAPSKPCGFTGRHEDHKPELWWCFWEARASRRSWRRWGEALGSAPRRPNAASRSWTAPAALWWANRT